MKHWTEEEKAVLKSHYANISARDLTKVLQGRSPGAVCDQAERLGLRKSHERLRELGSENVNAYLARMKRRR